MGKYIKLFETHSEYETYINGSDKILPNVSYCEDNDEVHFNPLSDPRVIAKFNVEDVTKSVALYDTGGYGIIVSELFSKIEIDGEEISISELEGDRGYYTFEATGEHTVKYTLLDPEVIGEGTFYDCSGLTSITIPGSVTSIGDWAFSDCSGLTSITIPGSVTSIGEYAFSGCSGLTSITIPNSVTSIGDSAFSDCSGLTSISVESGNTVYDSRNNCNAIIETATNTLLCGCLNTIIPNSVTSIGSSAFGYCSSLTRITIPNSVTSIGESAFRGCKNLTSITIPNGVTNIGLYTFGECRSLVSITIPNSVTSIGNNAFIYCRSLVSITLPSSVTSIGTAAFQGCSELNSITSQVTTAPTIQSNTFASVKTGGTLYVPVGSTGYDVWMGTGNYYLGKFNWTKVEQ